jgi:hypothetical protein
MPRLELQPKRNLIAMYDDELIGYIRYTLLRNRNILLPAELVTIDGMTATVKFTGVTVTDRFSDVGDGVRIEREWRVTRPGDYRFHFDFITSGTGFGNRIVPSVMYDGNVHGEGKFPKGGLDVPWSFREDRMPVPGCTAVYGESGYRAVFMSPAQDDSFTGSAMTFLEGEIPVFRLCVPFIEYPKTYTEKGIMLGGLTAPTERVLSIRPNQLPYTYKREFYVFDEDKPYSSADFFLPVFRTAWEKFAPPEETTPDYEGFFSRRLAHLRFLTERDDGNVWIKMGKGNGLFQSYYEFTAGSFLIRGLEAAAVYARIGDIDTAEGIAGFFLSRTFDNGAHQDMYGFKSKEWGGYLGAGIREEWKNGVNARANGETMSGFLRLYSLLKKAGREHPEYLDLARKNAEFYLKYQLPDGNFGRWRTLDGAELDSYGTNGAYIITLLTEFERLKPGDKAVRGALAKAADYYGGLADRMDFGADTLDADSTDKEAGCAVLTAFLDLNELTPDKKYIRYARRAAEFILSWIWTYNVAFPEGSPLGKLGFQTRGMTSVSVAHHHLDFYGMRIAYDFLRLADESGEEFWRDVARGMMRACVQLVSSPEERLGRGPEFEGWQPEQVNQTNWDYKHRRFGTKGFFHTDAAWSTVLTLGAMLDIRGRFPRELTFELPEKQ